jgi:hypothetical protein
MRELIRRILKESVQNNDLHLIQEHIDTSGGSNFTYNSLGLYEIGNTKRYYFNKILQIPNSNPNSDTIILSGDFGDFEFDKNLVYRKDEKTFYVNKKIFDEKYPKFTKKNKNSEKNVNPKDVGIDSSTIKKALKLAFPNNWFEKDGVYTSGLRGINTIGEKIKDESETWSIMNYFDTKKEIHNLLFLKYMETGDDKNIIDWMVDLFQNDKKFTQILVDRQWESIKNGLELERNSINSFFNVDPSNIKFYPHGSIMDRNKGIDVTVDGFNYQIKPLISYKKGYGSEYIINTYGMKDYKVNDDDKDDDNVDYIVYANKNGVLIFKNTDYYVVSKNEVIHKNSPIIKGFNNERVN